MSVFTLTSCTCQVVKQCVKDPLPLFFFSRIGFSIARRLAVEGAKVIVSSRSASNVDSAVKRLREEGLVVHGTVCHAGKRDDRTRLFQEVHCTCTISTYKLQ